MIRAPVVLFGFRRSDLLRSSLEELNRIGSLRVHVVLDGPPAHSPEIQKGVSQCREVLKSTWSALDIVPHVAEKNLGCRVRVLTGLDEVFQTEEEAIILEDDIRAGPDFFHLCNQGLELLRKNEQVGSICGTALKGIHRKIRSPVFLSRYTGSWGWATWGDRWKKFRQDNLKLNVLDQPEPPSWLKMEQGEWLFGKTESVWHDQGGWILGPIHGELFAGRWDGSLFVLLPILQKTLGLAMKLHTQRIFLQGLCLNLRIGLNQLLQRCRVLLLASEIPFSPTG